MTAKDILLVVIIPLILAEAGPWCGCLASRLLPWAARLRYGSTERAAVRLEEWSGDLGGIPGQLTKLAYALGQLAAGSVVAVERKTKNALRRPKVHDPADPVDVPVPTAEQDLLDLLQRSIIVATTRDLPDGQREAIVLRNCTDLSEAQIAASMGSTG